ncbi:hypothetical protein F0U60_15345 [Archangium minus]|uniref:Uncharacterized protein n=1 Tax=Archangium minus TaxID=83450 RepID=A0ABY9WNL9_9BACT|nr:hypothetical protein F0U60_15345 [Archangium minus]
MLTIRDAQIATFEGAVHQRFIEQLTEIMASDFADHERALGRPAFETVVRNAIEQAEGFGLRTSAEITDYVCTVLCCGERFHEKSELAWAGALLRSKDPERARKVLDQVLASLGARAAQNGPRS